MVLKNGDSQKPPTLLSPRLWFWSPAFIPLRRIISCMPWALRAIYSGNLKPTKTSGALLPPMEYPSSSLPWITTCMPWTSRRAAVCGKVKLWADPSRERRRSARMACFSSAQLPKKCWQLTLMMGACCGECQLEVGSSQAHCWQATACIMAIWMVQSMLSMPKMAASSGAFNPIREKTGRSPAHPW